MSQGGPCLETWQCHSARAGFLEEIEGINGGIFMEFKGSLRDLYRFYREVRDFGRDVIMIFM